MIGNQNGAEFTDFAKPTHRFCGGGQISYHYHLLVFSAIDAKVALSNETEAAWNQSKILLR